MQHALTACRAVVKVGCHTAHAQRLKPPTIITNDLALAVDAIYGSNVLSPFSAGNIDQDILRGTGAPSTPVQGPI